MANVGIEPGGNHAHATGSLLGALLGPGKLAEAGYSIEPVMDDGDYTNALLLTGPTGARYLVEVTPQENV